MSVIALILVIILYVRFSRLSERVRALEARHADARKREPALRLGERVARLENAAGAAALEESTTVFPSGAQTTSRASAYDVGEVARDSEPDRATEPPFSEADSAIAASALDSTARPNVARGAAAATVRSEPSSWKRIEARVMESWTGIVGTIVVVAGLTFLGRFAATQMTPFFRTLMIVGAAAILWGGALALERREAWRDLSHWVRSGAAAVFLFACFASSAIPGLSWIGSMAPALLVLVLGVAVNMLVAHRSRMQSVASLHVVVSLIPLALVPQSMVSLGLAAAVAGAGLIIASDERWELHACITLATYGFFQLFWHDRVFTAAADLPLKLAGAASLILVGSLSAARHYRLSYASMQRRTLPLIVHLGSWSLIACGLAVYSGRSVVRGISMIGAAIVLWIIARYGRRIGIRWIYLTDTIIAHSLAALGIVALYPFVFHWLLIPSVVFAQMAIFIALSIEENDAMLEKVSTRALHISGLVLVAAGAVALQTGEAIGAQCAVMLFAAAALGSVAQLHLRSRRGGAIDSLSMYVAPPAAHHNGLSALALIAGMLGAVGIGHLYPGRWLGLATLGLVATLAALARYGRSDTLFTAPLLVLCGGHVLAWLRLLQDHPLASGEQLVWFLAPLILSAGAAALLASTTAAARITGNVATFAAGLTLAVAAYTLLQPLSSLIPGVAWLILSIAALEMANRSTAGRVTSVLLVGYCNLVLFAGAYVLVVMQTQAHIGSVPARYAVEAFAIGVLAFWWQFRPEAQLRSAVSWRAVHPAFLELTLLFASVLVVAEVAAQLRPILWIALALAAIAPQIGVRLDARFRFYSVMLFWASVVDLAVVSSDLATGSAVWIRNPGITGAAAIVLQVVYLWWGAARLELQGISFPAPVSRMTRLSLRIGSRQHLWLYYPFFIGVALFLFWRFSAQVLTLLWAAEALIVYTLSLRLRENHFRYMALAGMAGCIARLLFFDMAGANLALRGAAFVGVGLVMLGMNALYNRYKDGWTQE